MRKPAFALLGIASFCIAIAFIAINIPTSQKLLLKRLATAAMTLPADDSDGLRVVVCGSASPLGMDPSRAQACIAVVTPEHFFLFDVGAGSAQRMAQAQLPLNRLDGVFLTHFHSDHIAALPDVNLNSWVMGRSDSLRVFGPTGISKVVDGFNLAYQLDRGYRMTHHGTELLPPEAAAMTAVPLEPGELGVVWKADGISMTAFAVDHTPISPAVGYRIDYKGRSVVISGDTVAVESLFEAAKDADLLFHDALSRRVIDVMIESAETAGRDRIAHIMKDVINYHANLTKLESMSEAAGVKQLVLYHMVPVPGNFLVKKLFRSDLSDDTILSEDLMMFTLPVDSTDIQLTLP